MSEFNRRQIVWLLWQNERADKFIREKLPVGVFAGHHQPPQKASSFPCRGPSTPALPPDPFMLAWHRAFLLSAREQLAQLAFQDSTVLWAQEPHSKGDYSLNEKCHFSPWVDTHVHCPLPQPHATLSEMKQSPKADFG